MRISFYAPFKPLDHPHPSGDLVIGNGIRDFLLKRRHEAPIAHRLRCRWLYWKPWLWPQLAAARVTVRRRLAANRPDLWLTYHSYYKAPDMLGPGVCRALGLPYVIFQGIYSTKRRRSLKTRPGFVLNTIALSRAVHVFSNRLLDLQNLRRIIPEQRLTYVPPGIYPEQFVFSKTGRRRFRKRFHIADTEFVAGAAAMFRPDVKTEGLRWLFTTLAGMDKPPTLLVAGDGSERDRLKKLAGSLPLRVIFTGKIKRPEMAEFYSAADIFTFPGINESLGMVFLEAQACGLPVVAFANGGIPEVVRNGETGFLTTPFHEKEYTAAVASLADKDFRHRAGRQGATYVRENHDLTRNYMILEEKLLKIATTGNRRQP